MEIRNIYVNIIGVSVVYRVGVGGGTDKVYYEGMGRCVRFGVFLGVGFRFRREWELSRILRGKR